MKDKKQQFGYTIVEVMIVLAVSGMMFVIAANFINGKQQRTSFFQGSNDMGNIIQKVIDDVTNGHYSDVSLSCTSPGGMVNVTGTSGDTQGTNPNCVFLGKLVHFYRTSPTTPIQNYEIISIADARSASGVLPHPTVAMIGDLTIKAKIPQSLIVSRMTIAKQSGTNIDGYSIGFVQSAGTIPDPSNGKYSNGGQTVSMVYSSMTNMAVPAVAGAFGPNLMPARSATICLTDGTRYANILIGGANSGGQLNVKVKQLGQDSSTCGV